jgi:hypothetical protein
MQKFRITPKLLIVMLLPLITAACATGGVRQSNNLLADAYGTSGIMKVKPYTRTIFSTTDF